MMIMDAVSATEVPQGANLADRAAISFLRYIEQKLNVSIMRDVRGSSSDQSLQEPLQLAALLKKTGVIKTFEKYPDISDEPRMKWWYALCNDATSHRTGGTTWHSDSDALFATLAEALERYIWYTQTDYFMNPAQTSVDGVRSRGVLVSPETFVGFSNEQRREPGRTLSHDAEYLWIEGTSLVRAERIFIPAQAVSGARYRNSWHGAKEPLLRPHTTNGLATWPTQTGARLAGALEILERDAYMIMWLNQLTLPRISLKTLTAHDGGLARSVAVCERYGLKTHALQLLTDAPTHAVAVVMEDMSGHAPRFTIGLRAHRSLTAAIQKAMTEALRARRGCRMWLDAGNIWDVSVPVSKIGHRERLFYWSVPAHAQKLEFLIQGPEVEVEQAAWENDNDEGHLQRIVEWCAKKEYECVAVSLGGSAKNPTPLFIEMVVIPELQPAYLTESTRAFGGKRLHDVPAAYGYTPLKMPFAERPHPFS